MGTEGDGPPFPATKAARGRVLRRYRALRKEGLTPRDALWLAKTEEAGRTRKDKEGPGTRTPETAG